MQNDTLTVVTLTFANTPICNMCAYIYVFYKTYCHKCHKCHFNRKNSNLVCDSVCDGCDSMIMETMNDQTHQTRQESEMCERRDEIAEKVMMLMLEKDQQWTSDPKPLAARAYAIADAMMKNSNEQKNDLHGFLPTGKTFTKR